MPRVKPRKIEEIAVAVSGELENAPKDFLISSIAVSPETSTTEDIVFVYDKKYLKDLSNIKAKSLILPLELKGKSPQVELPVIWVKRPRLVLKKLLELFENNQYLSSGGIHPGSIIHSSSKVAKTASIGAFVFIGSDSYIGEGTIINPNVYIGSGVFIGENCNIHANSTLMNDIKIGNNVIIHPGVVIGSDGYSYVTEEESNLEKTKKGDFNFNLGRQIQHKIPSIGGVVIEDDVEIGANSCVDAGTIGPTIIGAGTKIDNLVQIAHNCKIGKDCIIVGQVGFAGSVTTGDRVVAGGQSGFADNITIGNDVIFVARSAVHGDIPSNTVYMGVPAVPYQEYFKNEKAMRRLPRRQEKLEQQVKELEEKVKELEEKIKISV